MYESVDVMHIVYMYIFGGDGTWLIDGHISPQALWRDMRGLS